MGKLKSKRLEKKEATRKMMGMTLQRCIYLNRQMEAKVTQLRRMLQTTNMDHCGACGALGGRHSEACTVAEEVAFLDKQPQAETSVGQNAQAPA